VGAADQEDRAVGPDLRPRWAASLAHALADGCGLAAGPIDGDPDHALDCRIGARVGVDPTTNELPAARVVDSSSSSPVALPDGGVLYGAFTGYNQNRGHLVEIDAGGAIVATYPFGWDTTPAIYPHGGTYSVLTKDNTYATDPNGVDLGPYFIDSLDADLRLEWQFQSTNTKSCVIGPDGAPACVEDHPHGFEWCINAPAVDADGTVYANSEDGNVYAIEPGGRLRQTLFLSMSIGAAYTPLAFDGAGRLYTLNNGSLMVIGR
jgi:outer membrane protein assembly factor BamB